MFIPRLSALIPQILLSSSLDHSPDSHQNANADLQPSLSTATVLIPQHRPAFAERIDPHLVAFSIEADRWPDWAGHEVGKPNEFTRQVLRNLEERSGVGSAIRVGADSEDRTHLNLALPIGHATFPPSTPEFPYPEAERIEIGRDWYRLSQNFAAGTLFSWGLIFKSLNISETEAQAKHLAKAFSANSLSERGSHIEPVGEIKGRRNHVKLEAVEIGNEPELYYRPQSGGGVPNPGDWTKWSVTNYTSTWLEYARAALKHLDLREGGTLLRVGDIQFAGSASGWAPQSIIEAGLFDEGHSSTERLETSPLAPGDASTEAGRSRQDSLDNDSTSENGKRGGFARKHVKVYSEHMYQANYAPGHEARVGELMDKWNVRGNLSGRAMDVVACKKEGLAFVLGETSTYSSHGSPGTSNTAESALWAIDFLLQAASMGISRAYLSHGVGYMYSSFQPIGGITDDGRGLERSHVMMLYYGLLVVNEAIGPGTLEHVSDAMAQGITSTLGGDSKTRGEVVSGVQGKGEEERYVVELSTEHPNIVSYGIYHDRVLRKIVLVNTHVLRRSDDGDTGAVDIHLSGLAGLQKHHRAHSRAGQTTVAGDGVDGSTARMKRLKVPHTAAVSGVTWAGQDFDTPSGRPEGEVQLEEICGDVLRLAASSAVLLYL